MSDELSLMDATAQAELVRRGDLAPSDLLKHAIARIERIDPQINAVVVPLFDLALDAASGSIPEGPFRGVPFVLKDIGTCQGGLPQYRGNRVLREMDYRFPSDTPLGRRFRDAGFIVLGKTATPEFGFQPTTQSFESGPTRNPWDLDRSTSGSSGGSAAAVASGMVAVAHANDGGGSIRQPASWCGLVGLKPTRGRTSQGPAIGRLGAEHVVTKSVRDTAAILDAVHGPEAGDLHIAPPPLRPYVDELRADPGKLRIGVMTQVAHDGVDTDPECVAAVKRTAALLESLGHIVEDSFPARVFDEEFLANAENNYIGMARMTYEALWRSIGRRFGPQDVEPYTWARIGRADELRAIDFLESAKWLQSYASRVVSWWHTGFDLLLTPATGRPPALLTELVPPQDDPWWIDHNRFSQIRCFARPFNVTGQPCISLPLEMSSDGLPIGIQFVADMGREDLLIRLASQLEQASPWVGRLNSVIERFD